MVDNPLKHTETDQEYVSDLLKISQFVNQKTDDSDALSELIEEAKPLEKMTKKTGEHPYSSLRFFYQQYTPFEKTIRYNLRHGYILFSDLYKGSIPETATSAAVATLSVANGTIQLVDGVLQISKETLHPTRDKAMGTLKILSGATGIALSYAPWITQLGYAGLSSATALAPPAFALTRLVDLTCAAIDYYYARKELKLSGWLEERYKEINTIDDKMSSSSPDKTSLLFIEKKNIEDNIRARIFCEAERSSDRVLNKIHFKDKETMKLYKTHCKSVTDLPEEIQNQYREKDNNLSKEAIANAAKKQKEVAIKALAFSGALLLAIAPFTGPAAPVLGAIGLGISIAVGVYIVGKLVQDQDDKKIKQLFTEVKDKLAGALARLKPPSPPAYSPLRLK